MNSLIRMAPLRLIKEMIHQRMILIHVILLIRRDLYFYIQTNEFKLKIILIVKFLLDFYTFE